MPVETNQNEFLFCYEFYFNQNNSAFAGMAGFKVAKSKSRYTAEDQLSYQSMLVDIDIFIMKSCT